jgi:hypothetical protein
VTVGLANSRYVEIRDGLKEGDQVIYSGHEALREGDPVVPTAWGPSGLKALPPATAEEKAAPGAVYTCPMHPEVRMDHPGNCPKCGMKLQPVAAAAAVGGGRAALASRSGTPQAAHRAPAAHRLAESTGGAATYYCPMDKDVHSNHPGKCPKCGMDLVLRPADEQSGAAGKEADR